MRHLITSAAIAVAVLFAAPHSASAHERTLGWCDNGFTATLSTIAGKKKFQCIKWENRPHRVYYIYTPCVSPGVYRANDEVPNGRHRGRDRCTAAGISGPALPCSPGKRVEIVRGARDKCYVLEQKTLVKGKIRVGN